MAAIPECRASALSVRQPETDPHLPAPEPRPPHAASPGSLRRLPTPQGHPNPLFQIELSGTERFSMTALKDLIERVRTDLVRAGIDGTHMLETSPDWTRLLLGGSCNVTLYS